MKATDKSSKLIIAAAVALCGIIIAGGIFMLFNRFSDGNKPAAIGEITEFESLTVRFSGMRITEEYEIISNGETSEISQYYIKYDQQEDIRELQASAVCQTQEVIDILNECKAGKWNGFHGEHPKGVLDGTMFNLTASVNGGQKLSADGSQNFPKNFRTFEDWLYEKTR